ncbi:ferritin-like domain-containing protein [Conexibacter sp. CPCC 206217]|uniref:ferritin-like domain-containing protein n=1 Tax=Conexibacter sp. CPCC 206217 TaxID=3064574 RepID=UPI00272475BD|nr:ferritin-like domain-containing protein [Conexibacter sp. CPCC 206217]MDO8209500.1 ferritin-like domain-containing protein [Conexibacter sp. CPCC 206217]
MKPQLTDLISLETLDRDGALREQEAAVAGDTRADLFRKAGIAGGTLIASGVLFGGMPALAGAAKPSKKQDTAILNYALTLEYLEAAFYKEALKAKFSGDLGKFATLVAADEAAHVKALKGVLGKSAVRSPTFDFGDTTSNEAKFRATAFALETTGVAAYSGQATNIKQVPIIRAAVSILTIEARHAGAIAALNGNIAGRSGVTPNGPFDVAYSMSKVLGIVRGTGFITG